MADKRVKYIADNGPFCEVGITGKQTSWRKNQSGFVTEANALLLIATGKFVLSSTDYGPDQDVVDYHTAEHVSMGNPVLAVGVPFRLFSGNGSNSGLQWAGLRGTFTLSAAIYTSHYYSQIVGGYAYLPANFGGITIPAGWYFYKMTSDTAGELYKDVYTSGIPTIPANPVPFGDSELSAGWLTQTTAEVTAINIPSGFKGNSMGPNGLFESILRLGGNSGNSGKYVRIRLGSSMVQGIMIYGTTLLTGEALLTTRNQGVINSQSQGKSITNANGNGVGFMTNTDSSASRSTIDTSITADLSVTMQLTANTDALLLYGVLSRITYGA